MPNLCGKGVNSLGTSTGKTGGLLSTVSMPTTMHGHPSRAKPAVQHRFARIFAQPFSTTKTAPRPLAEHNFYPLSTAPITTTTK